MKTEDFNYNLPKKYIAQYPPMERGTTRLMVLDKNDGFVAHQRYSDIPSLVNKNDVIVLNETKVLKVRLFAKVVRTGREVEVFLLRKLSEKQDSEKWSALIGRARHVRIGDVLRIGSSEILVLLREEGQREFVVGLKDAHEVMKKYGHVPLPPYISREDTPEDDSRYNTVFAQNPDSSAAPTASLNLTEEMIGQIEEKGATLAKINLAVGLGTFAPVNTSEVEDFNIHAEYVTIPEETVTAVNSCAGRVWAFGTTVVRSLESAAVSRGKIREFDGDTDLYIYPGYDFKIVDVMVTNFHMPGTSLIMLVSAFAGRKYLLHAYERAKKEGYQFLSYGDSMVIIEDSERSGPSYAGNTSERHR